MLADFYYKYIELNLKDYSNIGFDFEINKVLFFVFLGLIAASIFTNYIQSSLALLIKKLLRTNSFGEENSKTLSDLGLKDNRAVKYALSRGGGAAASIIAEAGKSTPTYEDYLEASKREREEKKKKREAFFAKFKKKSGNGNAASEETGEAITIESADSNTSVQEQENSDADAPELRGDIKDTEESAAEEGVTKEAAEGEKPLTSNELLSKQKPDFTTARFYIPADKEEYAKRYFNTKSSSVAKTALSCALLLGFYIALVLLMPTILSAVNAILGG